jgi:hypothetical protein
MALVFRNSSNGSQSRKASNKMDASKNRDNSNSRKAMAVAENISNNRDSNIVIGGVLDRQGVKIINFEGGEKII